MSVWTPRRVFAGCACEHWSGSKSLPLAPGNKVPQFATYDSTSAMRPKRTMHALKAIVPAVMAISLVAATIGGCHLPGRKSRVMERADRYFKAGEYEKAKIEYMNVLRLDRTNRTAIKQLGIIWFEEGAPLRAFPFLRAPRDLDPNDFGNRTKLASAFLMLGEVEGARKEALTILQQSPGEGQALLVVAD